MSNPRVTHVCWTLGRAGAERMILDLAKRLPEHGFDVNIISAGRGGELAADIRAANIPLSIGPETRDRFKTLDFLRGEFSRKRPDVLHTHLGADVWAGYLAWRHRIRPWVITAHSAKSYDAWLPGMLHRLAFRQADRVVCVSEAVRTFVKKTYGVHDDRLVVIPNGVDLAPIRERGSGSFQDIPQLIVVGRLVPGKRVDLLLRALALVKRPWHLDIFGDGPERGSLERLAETLGMFPRVTFHGVSRDIFSELPRADLFCFPTEQEGQGLALFEAVGSGVPAVVSDLPVFREAFDEQSMAYVDGSTPSAWAESIERILQDPRPSLLRAAHAQAIVRERYSVERMVVAYAELYHEMLG